MGAKSGGGRGAHALRRRPFKRTRGRVQSQRVEEASTEGCGDKLRSPSGSTCRLVEGGIEHGCSGVRAMVCRCVQEEASTEGFRD